MPDPTRRTLTIKKPPPPEPVAAALTNACLTSVESSFDQAARMPLSIAALLAGERAPALGLFFGPLDAPAEIAVNASPTFQENSDVVQPE